MARRKKRRGVYHFFIVLPERLYPFSAMVAGSRVRGIRAYESRVRMLERRYGRGHLGVWLHCYRSFFHVVGAVLIIVASALVTQRFFGNQEALYAMLGTATVLISFQEFYYHRREYAQLWGKSVIDWLSWVVPIGIYLFYFR
jgi:hypothetical protein